MSELKLISPLLDGMLLEKEGPKYNGRAYYTLRDRSTGEQYILKILSVPSSDSHVRALILSGAYADEAAVHEYYSRYVEDIRQELKVGKELDALGCFAGAQGYQIELQESGVGFDVYILLKLHVTLSYLLEENAITGLRALNLGIDICDALISCREAGYLFANLTPDSIYLTPKGKFLLGDLGLTSLADLEYACVPEEYIGAYSAPELSDITESPNTTIDLYSLGMVLFRIYNGNHSPYEDENTGEGMADKLRLSGKPLPTPIYADYELAGIIQKACAFRKEDRYTSPEEMKQALVQYMQRNEVSDQLIVPPIVVSSESLEDLPEEMDDEQEETLRMTSEQELDDTFRQSFAPDLTGGGSESDVEPEPSAMNGGTAIFTPLTRSAVQSSDEEEEASAETDEASSEAPSEEADEAAEAHSDDSSEVPEDTDPDQIDIDSLLASISNVIDEGEQPHNDTSSDPDSSESAENSDEGLRLHFGQSVTTSHDYVDSSEPSESSEELEENLGKEKRSKLSKILIILLLLAAIGAVVYFLISWYFVEASTLNIHSVTTEEIVVQLVSDDDQNFFVLTCTDSHGNSYPATAVGDQYRFTGLSELNTYTITVKAADSHRLTGSSIKSHTVTTPENTYISDFSVSRGEADGEVLLTFRHDGPAPAQWNLTYTNEDGSDSGSYRFDGNAYLVGGLNANQVYTFTLEDTDNIFIAGEYEAQYELLPIVEVKELTVSELSAQSITLTWQSGENVPQTWNVVCEAEGMESIEMIVEEPLCVLSLPDLKRDYLISVSARGMDDPETLSFSADPIIVDNFTAAVHEDHSVTLSWETPAGSPSGGWYLSYNTAGSLHSDYMAGSDGSPIEGNSVTLSHLIPNADYIFTLSLTSSDASKPIFGTTTVTAKTAQAANFDSYGITPAAPLVDTYGYVSLWTLPTKEGWKYTDLKNHKEEFAADEKIAVCIEVNAVDQSADEVHLLYAIRNSQGQIVNDISTTMVWDDLWYSRRHANAIPLPAASGESSVPGAYTLEIYANGKLLAYINFSIA